eukprot:CAMPEP_0172452504 /NCGR_PEP_ID=MMETSP1065-20121228/10145_1 /TAXON_ID=265537 /ORGANISM="Amphiprora paludosa, Strain CCMP125" /LENGTH=281 /DNA_ID=CAMNT_0013204569 /DNA_START=90 /DNA_END=935 /DNA_ORIENTATION=-
MRTFRAVTAVAMVLTAVQGFAPQRRLPSSTQVRAFHSPSLYAKSSGGKGFGNAASPEKTPESTPSSTPLATTTPTPAATTPASPEPPLNVGQKALAELRRQKAEEQNAELQKMRDMLRADQQVSETPAAIPEKVAQRMGNRMLAFVGVPLFLGLGSFVAFWYLATYRDLEFQPALVAGTTIGILAISLLGITYSVMSTSWDEDRTEEEGILGLGEFQKNVGNIQEGLQRSKENAILRDKMATSSNPQQMAQALKSLDAKEEKSQKSKAPASLQSKLQDELE